MADITSTFANKQIEDALSYMNARAKLTQVYSGVDVQCVMYLPLMTRGKVTKPDRPSIQVFADLQTFSISSTRSITPVRVLGRSSPLQYTRGARTFAGTLSFATINKDAFADIYDVDIAESYINASTSMIIDQLPPFSIVMTAGNESGGAVTHVVHGVTLVNYGTTYSIDNLYTETTYSYVATDISPALNTNAKQRIDTPGSVPPKTATAVVEEEMKQVYTSKDHIYLEYIKKIQDRIDATRFPL